MVLGYVDPAYFNGGRMVLDVEAAARVIATAGRAAWAVAGPAGGADHDHRQRTDDQGDSARSPSTKGSIRAKA